MPIDSARVSKADGSQSLEVPAEQGAVPRRATEEFEQRVFLSTLNDMRNFCEAYAGSRNRGRSRNFRFGHPAHTGYKTCSPERKKFLPDGSRGGGGGERSNSLF